jgi:hypothetical protein
VQLHCPLKPIKAGPEVFKTENLGSGHLSADLHDI